MTHYRGNVLRKFFGLAASFIFFVAWPVTLCILYYFGAVVPDIETIQELKTATATSKGIIVSCKIGSFSTDSGEVTTCQPTVDFTTASGEKIEFVSDFWQGDLLLHTGKEVTVSYNPHNPHEALITSLETWIGVVLNALGALVGVLWVILGLTVFLKKDSKVENKGEIGNGGETGL